MARSPALVAARGVLRQVDPWWVELALALVIVLLAGAVAEVGEADPRTPAVSSATQGDGDGQTLAAFPAQPDGGTDDATGDAPVVDFEGTGEMGIVPGETSPAGAGPVHSFTVEVEKGLDIDEAAFAERVVETLSSPRGWGQSAAFQRVDSGNIDFRVTLASPDLTDELCLPHLTHGIYSCYEDGRAVINFMRWMEGADSYGSDLNGYRTYLINHEVGHAIGYHAHESCPAPGEPAPIMMQQTKGVAPCTPNPWP